MYTYHVKVTDYTIALLLFPSIRALFGDSMLANAVHGSSTAENAMAAIQTFIGEIPEDGEDGEGRGEEEKEGGK